MMIRSPAANPGNGNPRNLENPNAQLRIGNILILVSVLVAIFFVPFGQINRSVSDISQNLYSLLVYEEEFSHSEATLGELSEVLKEAGVTSPELRNRYGSLCVRVRDTKGTTAYLVVSDEPREEDCRRDDNWIEVRTADEKSPYSIWIQSL